MVKLGDVVGLKFGVCVTVFGLKYGGLHLGEVQRWGDTTTGSPSFPSPCRVRAGQRARPSLCLQVVEKGGPYPLIVLPQFGGYWIEDPENVGTPTSLGSSICEEEEEDSLSPSTFGYKLECKGEARAYRRHFLGKVRLMALRESSCRAVGREMHLAWPPPHPCLPLSFLSLPCP